MNIVNSYSSTVDKMAIMQAYLNGKTVECRLHDSDDPWEVSMYVNHDQEIWDFDNYEYHIKSELLVNYVVRYDDCTVTLRTFKTREEAEGYTSSGTVVKMVEEQ